MPFFKTNNQIQDDHEVILSRQNQLQNEWKNGNFKHLFSVSENLSCANQCNCENMIGSVSVPVGLAGPAKVILSGQETNCFMPLATSEGALVASVSRGLKAINQAGGSQVIVKNFGMTRAPVFAFKNGQEAFAFVDYLENQETIEKIKEITEATSSHLKLKDLKSFVRGRNVYVRFSFFTDQAMGMNMVTIALQKLWEDLLINYEGIEMLALSSNVCIDKKASFINQLLGRGYSAQAEVFLSEEILQNTLKTTSKALLKTHHSKNLMGSNLAGSNSQNMQFANVVAAFYLATGQDMAHVTEASQGNTIIEETNDGLYVAVNLPDLPLGTIGGGVNLPSQKELRELICQDKTSLTAVELAAILAIGVLAAEISGLAALSSNTLAKAHQRLARKS